MMSEEFPETTVGRVREIILLRDQVERLITEGSDLVWLADTLSDVYLGGESGWRECGVKKLFDVVRASSSPTD